MTPRTRRRIYLREAAIMLMLARLAVRILPSARLLRWADRPMKKICRFPGDDVAWTAWAIEHAAKRQGAALQCLPRALAAHAMLRRRGIASRICLGVARHRDHLIAHAWIEVGSRKLVGGDDSERFTPLAAFGGAK